MKNDLQNSIEVTFHPEIPALEIVWTTPVNSDTLHQIYNEVLEEMKQHQVKHLLLDIRNRGLACGEEDSWMFTEFVPQLIGIFGSNIGLAYVLSESSYKQMLADEDDTLRLENHSELFRISFFTCRQEALTWIQGKLAA